MGEETRLFCGPGEPCANVTSCVAATKNDTCAITCEDCSEIQFNLQCNGTCSFECDASGCSNMLIHINGHGDTTLNCGGENSCENTIVDVDGDGSRLVIQCTNPYACRHMDIDMSGHSSYAGTHTHSLPIRRTVYVFCVCVFRFGDVFRKCFLVKLLLRTKLMSVDLSMACAEHIACNNTRVNCVDRTVCQVECTESENCPVNVSYNLSFSLSLSLS